MRTLMAVTALLVSLVVTGCSPAGDAARTDGTGPAASSVQTVEPQEFLSAAAEDGVVVLDVRTPQEFDAGHLDGATNLNLDDPAFTTLVADLDPATTYAVYCQSGRRSALASQAMADAGLTSIYNLSGGIGDLAAAGGPVVTS